MHGMHSGHRATKLYVVTLPKTPCVAPAPDAQGLDASLDDAVSTSVTWSDAVIYIDPNDTCESVTTPGLDKRRWHVAYDGGDHLDARAKAYARAAGLANDVASRCKGAQPKGVTQVVWTANGRVRVYPPPVVTP